MEYTQNYALRKPGLNEYANVGDLNFNADKIDSQMKKNQDVDGEVYDPTSTSANAYEAGDYVINPDDGLMYVCNGTTYGTWDATKWDHTTEFEELQKAMASGGESELADLHDVEITNPTDGQALLYDPTSLKWHNSDLPDADVTKTASGNPIEFEDGANAPLVKCVTQITGSQDLHGYDKPWVGGAGKNKLPLVLADIKSANTSGTWSGNSYTLNGVTFTIETDGDDNVTGIKANGTSTADWVLLSIPTFTLTAGNYILNGCINGALESYRIDMTPSGTTNLNGDTAFSVSADSQFSVRCIIRQSGYTANNVMLYPMIRLSTETDSTFAPYSNICPITAYTEGKIVVRGKNMLPNKMFQYNVYNAFIGKEQSTDDDIWLEPGTYTLQIDCTNTSYHINYGVNGGSAIIVSGVAPSEWTFTVTEKSSYRFWLNDATGITVAQVKNFQLVKGSESLPYEPYTSTTHTTTYPTSIYRGSEDCVKGEVTSNMPVIDLGDLTWNCVNNTFYATLPSDSYKYKVNVSSLCSHYNYIGTVNNGTSDMQNVDDASYALFFNTNYPTSRVLYVKDTRYTDASTFTTAVTGVKLAYELATPTTESITPTNLPIRTLSGYNHIESSTGDMEIEYFHAKEQPLIDLIPEASNMHEYSTAEHAVGTWVDGKTVYEQTYVFTNAIIVTTEWTSTGIASDGIDAIIDSVVGHTTGQTWNGMGCLKDGGYIKLANPYGGSIGINFLIIRYTKPTVSRSLAKGEPEEEIKSAPQEETKEEQVEELKEEPTEEVKEEPEEAKEEPEEETKEEGEINER